MRQLPPSPELGTTDGHADRPRRFHLVNLGLPKTGTTSVAAMFPGCRTGHEYWFEPVSDVLFARGTGTATSADVVDVLSRRDEAGRLEVDSASFLHHVAAEVVGAFPNASFMATWRPFPSWLDSFLGLMLRNGRRHEGRPWPAWQVRLGAVMLGDGFDPAWFSDEAGLARSLDDVAARCLSFWVAGNERVLAALPADALLLPTSALDDAAPVLARFVGVPEDAVKPARENVGTDRRAWSAELDPALVAAIADRAGPVADALVARSITPGRP